MHAALDERNPQVYSVSELNAYIRGWLESNENLMDIWVSGEVSNLSQPSSGHIYFTLKDTSASLRCVIWREHAWRLREALKDGMAVEVHGAVGVYEQGGVYQLYVDRFSASGEGLLYQEFLRLKTELEAEGLFAQERKRPLPELPMTIGVVTSPSGAALQDILNTLRNRYPLGEVILSPTPVQGEAAPQQITDAIDLLNRTDHPDVIIIARGGGSLEDLWAFNDARVVRAVAASAAPVVSGVGHETDFTLTDFAADVRAPTPTGATVAAVPETAELKSMLAGWGQHLDQHMQGYMTRMSNLVATLSQRLEFQSPQRRIRQAMQSLDETSFRLANQIRQILVIKKHQLEAMSGHLNSLDPHAVLRRGYALVQDTAGGLLTRIDHVQLGQDVTVLLTDGSFNAGITAISKQDPSEEPYG
jgi:exodeoxyribonuclease VII large subunit